MSQYLIKSAARVLTSHECRKAIAEKQAKKLEQSKKQEREKTKKEKAKLKEAQQLKSI